MKKIITFDLYGTLVDISGFNNELAKIGAEHGISGEKVVNSYTVNEARVMYGEPFRRLDNLIAEVLKRCDADLKTDFLANQFDRLFDVQSHFPAFPDTVPALRELKEHGYTLYVMSNSCHQIIGNHMDALDHLIDGYLLAEDVKGYKPQYVFFEEAEKRFDLKAADVRHCHVAQGYFYDIIPATHFGWNKIWMNRNGETGLPDQQPYKEFSTLEGLRPVLDAMLAE